MQSQIKNVLAQSSLGINVSYDHRGMSGLTSVYQEICLSPLQVVARQFSCQFKPRNACQSLALFQGGEQLFLYVTVFDGQVMSKTEVWARIRNSSAAPNSTELNNERPAPGATVFLPNFRPQFPVAGSSGGGNIPPGFIHPSPSVPEISRKPKPPPPPPPPPLSIEQTTLKAASPTEEREPTRGLYHLPLPSPSVTDYIVGSSNKFAALF
jgi:hypothetical protein